MIVQIFFQQTFILEILAVTLSLLYVFLAARGNPFCWPAAFVSSAIYAYLCYLASLFPESILQVFYVLFAIYGGFKWKRVTLPTSETDVYKRISRKTFFRILYIGSLLTLVIGWYFDKHTSAALPWLDAPIVVFSLISTWLVAEKIIENWYFWIVIDLAAAYLYFARDMHLTSLLYLFYTILAFWGLLQWKKNWHEST